MLSSLKHRDAKREEGFTLIELLVVVIIIGILAAIAIPVFLNQRERAWISATTSDLRNGAVQMETYFTDNSSYPDATGAPAAETKLTGFKSSDGVTVTIQKSTSAGYCLQAVHANLGSHSDGATYVQDTRAGGAQRPVALSTGCPA